MIQPLISVIVPVYNGEKYIEPCLRSILQQTYRTLEVIVVDDGSTDHTADCISSLRSDSRLTLVRQNNQGSAAARNRGLEICHGELVSFIDADDWIDVDFYSKLVSALVEQKGNIAMCNIIAEDGKYICNHLSQIVEGEDILYELLNRQIPHRVMNKIYERSVLESIRFSKGRNMFEDGPWTAKVMAQCHRLICIHQAAYHYRLSENSLSRKKDYTDEERAEFWANKLERDQIILAHLHTESYLQKGRQKLEEHLKEAFQESNCITYHGLADTIQRLSDAYGIIVSR